MYATPTVYSNAHLGNLRTFMFFDVAFRYLLHLGYKVRYVRNITDVSSHLENDADEGEDRIAKKARLEQIEPMEVVQKYTVDFHNVLSQYNFLPPSIEPTATGHIVEQIGMIKIILDKGFAYEVNGSVYFDVLEYNKTNHYGILSGRNIKDTINNTRDLDGQSDKKSTGFCPVEKSRGQAYHALVITMVRTGFRMAYRMFCDEHQILGRGTF